MKSNLHVVVIDPQNDFCDLPESWLPVDPLKLEAGDNDPVKRPQLAVPGAHADMLRVSEAIRKGSKGISDISITLDSHHFVAIERPTFWMKKDGSAVDPFTVVTAQLVKQGEFMPRSQAALPRVVSYLEALETAGKTHMIWPVHCEIGTWGYNVHDSLRAAYNEWEKREFGVVQKVTKGSNPWTEHFSPLMAEVPDPNDPSTQLNTGFIQDLMRADKTFLMGEAGSHCLRSGVLHLVDNWGTQSLDKLVLVKDGMSPVSGFEAQQDAFLVDMQKLGLQVCTCDDMAAELVANGKR